MWNKKEMSQMDTTLTRVPLTLTFDFHFKVKLYLGKWRPDSHGTKGTEVDGIPWCKTLRKWVNWTLCWLGYIWTWHLTLTFRDQVVSREWEARLSWSERDKSRLDVLVWNTKEMGGLDAALTGVPLALNFQGHNVSREWEAQLSWNERGGSR